MKMKKVTQQTAGIIRCCALTVFFLGLAMCGEGPEDALQKAAGPVEITRIVGIGRIEPEMRIAELAGEVQGIVETIHLYPGDRVKKGEPVLDLVRDIEKANVEQARARLNARSESVLAYEASLKASRIRLDNVKTNRDRIEALFEQGAATSAGNDEARANYESLVQETNRLEAELKSTRFLMEQDMADYHMAVARLKQKEITAPADGELLSLDVTVGSPVTPGESFGAFAPESPVTALCEIDELFAPDVRTGQKAVIRSEGMTDTLATGTVSFTGPYLRRKSIFSDDVGDLVDRRVREVRIRIEKSKPLLFGQRVECVIQLEGKE